MLTPFFVLSSVAHLDGGKCVLPMAWFWFMSKRKLALVLFVVGLITWLLFVLLRQTYFLPYARIIIKLASTDSHRFADNDRILTEQAWRLHAFETRFSQEFYCKDKPGREDVAWLTVLVNDKYLVPTLVLGHALRTFSCQKTMLAFLSEGVSESARTALRKVGWMIRDVEQMDCNWMERQLGRPQLNFGLTGTHTRFHAWNMTEYSKIIHLDPDYMPLAHMDELFSLPGDFYASYCARPGILDPCFNAGMLVFRPDKELHRELMTFWTETSRSHRCLNDQVLHFLPTSVIFCLEVFFLHWFCTFGWEFRLHISPHHRCPISKHIMGLFAIPVSGKEDCIALALVRNCVSL